jgi:hypothetical protein
MGQLHDRMAEDLVLRNLSPATRRNYLLYCRNFAAFYRRSPAELGEDDIRRFLLHCLEVQKLSYGSYRPIYAALKFLFTVTLQRPWAVQGIPFPKNRVRPFTHHPSRQRTAGTLCSLSASRLSRLVYDLLCRRTAHQRSLPSSGR